MTIRADAPSSSALDRASADTAKVYQEGIVAGTLGAVTLALWFLVIDTIGGRPLYTPNLLGTALFHGGAGLDAPHTLPIDFDMVFVFTWLHLLIFAVIGGIASRLLALAEERPNAGFGILLFFVVFEFGFIAVAMILAEQVLHALAWPAILVGNTLAATSMALYFWRRHPHLHIEP